jgi:hypothetical protein
MMRLIGACAFIVVTLCGCRDYFEENLSEPVTYVKASQPHLVNSKFTVNASGTIKVKT